MTPEFASLLTGRYAPRQLPQLAQAIKTRFITIRPKLVERKGDYCYDGNRTAPDEVAYRPWTAFVADVGDCWEAILRGEKDAEIEEIWHERAQSEHWYRYEKDWGWGY